MAVPTVLRYRREPSRCPSIPQGERLLLRAPVLAFLSVLRSIGRVAYAATLTRWRPSRLASYSAASARAIVACGAVSLAAPIGQAHRQRHRERLAAAVLAVHQRHLQQFFGALDAPPRAWRRASRTTNSSPPRRAHRSPGRRWFLSAQPSTRRLHRRRRGHACR